MKTLVAKAVLLSCLFVTTALGQGQPYPPNVTIYAPLSGATFTGPVGFSVGSNTSPGITWAGDTETGFYWVSSGILAYTTTGTEKFTFGTNISSANASGGQFAGSSGIGSPSFIPDKAADAGLGTAAAGDVSLYCYESSTPTECLRVDTSGLFYVPGIASSTAAQTGYLCWKSSSTPAGEFKNRLGTVSPKAALKEVLALDPFYGTYKPVAGVPDKHVELFFGAHETEKVDRKLVAYDSSGKLRSVQYDKVSVVNTAAIKALQGEIKELQKEVGELKR
jgi:hypothetical protein